MSERIAEALVAKGLLDRPRAELALRDRERTGLGFGQLVVERGWVPDDVYADVLAMLFGVARVRFDQLLVDPSVVADLDEGWARLEGLLPLHPIAGRREVRIATVDPENLRAIDALSFRLGRRVEVGVVSRAELLLLLRHVFRGEALPGAARPTPVARGAPLVTPEPPPASPTPGDAEREALARAVSENKQAARALQAIFDLCVERGLVSQAELEQRLAGFASG